MVLCSDRLFATFEAHYTDALFFNELDDCAQDCDPTIISTPLPTWADAQKGIFHPPALVQTSDPSPQWSCHLPFMKLPGVSRGSLYCPPEYQPRILEKALLPDLVEVNLARPNEQPRITEMPGLHPSLVSHYLNVLPNARLVKQGSRTFRPELELQIKEEVQKLLDAGFIKPIIHPTWLANIVPVQKKNRQIRVCVDFRDLNKACPKDDFPLSIIDTLINGTAGHEMFSFMDGFSGYNQIRMATGDAEKTAF
ncbi:uncharacterized protein LOC132309992 [Cornus florida]|uniref:uncharacterized protein LOC132309992 n=1 Tax=Cornus florida TaxID=4283 RepID=UPI0028A22458|nr:uncharacterized protein LOC132309992 [Cornus florida]